MNGEKKETFITIKKASLFTGLHPQTLRALGDSQKLLCYKTPSGQRRFDKSCLEKMCNPVYDVQTKEVSRINFIYTRVSSKKQLDDLSRQIEYIKQRTEYASYTVISDVASGINFKRKGLQTILDACRMCTLLNYQG